MSVEVFGSEMKSTRWIRSRPLSALVGAAVFSLGLVAAPATNAAEPPRGATWHETYIDTPDGESLHADVLRPKGIGKKVKTPVILVVSPYLGMSSATAPPGPSDRFYDFFEGADVFRERYSVVMVSLRGTGGSSGCLDILGPGEQTDVRTAVRWAASQPWSTGKVGMYGKSYDANTGTVAAALRPKGLAAVVAQQIVPDRYRGSYSDRVRYLQSLAFPIVSYGTNGEGGFSLENDPEYITNSVSRSADCQVGLLEHYGEDSTSDFWQVRDFAKRAKGSRVPTFITVGYLDANTNPGGGAIDFLKALRGPKRMWIGWWDHVRGNDTVGNRLAMGRKGFFGEVMRFFDHYVKGLPLGKAPTHRDPVIAAQSSDGSWRREPRWPPTDSKVIKGPLLEGSYRDDGTNLGSNDTAAGPGGLGFRAAPFTTGHGSWTFSPPLPHEAHLAGVPSATVKFQPQAPRTNLVVNVYDLSPEGEAIMVTRGAALVDEGGRKKVLLYPTDWIFEREHRIGVLVSGANADAYLHVPTLTTISVEGGFVSLPFLRHKRSDHIQGEIAPRLEDWLRAGSFSVDDATIAERTNDEFKPPRKQKR